MRWPGRMLLVGLSAWSSGCGILAAAPEKSAPHESKDASEHDAPLDGAADATPPAQCALADAGVGSTAAGGTASGAGVTATVCTTATLYLAPWTDPYYLLEMTLDGPSSFESPAEASDGRVFVEVSVASASPGTYSSSDANACGTVQFGYRLPSSLGVSYEAAIGASDCLGGPQRTSGSWTLKVTSVDHGTSDSGFDGAHFAVHGSFEAQLPGGGDMGDAGAGAVALALVF